MQLLNASTSTGVNGSLDNLTNPAIVCNTKLTGLLIYMQKTELLENT